MTVRAIIIFILAYLIGSVPSAWIMGKIFRGQHYDIRDHGSGNVGTTNVIRNLGWLPGLMTFIIDSFKGFAVVFWMPELITSIMNYDIARVLLSVLVLVGHTFPVFIRFRGGKAVATSAGIIFAFHWEICIIGFFVFLIVLLISRKSAIASISAAFSFPAANLFFHFVLNQPVPPPILWFSIALPFFILYTHRENIRKIISGTSKKDF